MDKIKVIEIFDKDGPSFDEVIIDLFKVFLIDELKKDNINEK